MSSAGSATIRPVILCGGAGTRLWPVSRDDCPKQFLQLLGDQSLIQQTVERVNAEEFMPPIIVTAENQSFLLDQQMQQVGATIEAILLEPLGRNTAAAATLAATWLEATDRNELLLLMPSDHVIGDRCAFFHAVMTGVPHAQAGSIVTFGAQPSEPNTQYGYIEAEADCEIGEGVFRIARFHEKPNADQAAAYIATGRFSWNCGIFLAKASTLLEEMQRHLAPSLAAIRDSIANRSTHGLFVRPSADAFAKAENISIDHAVMEKTSQGVVVPVQMKWSDVGAWDAVWKLAQKDENGNVIHGNVMSLDSRNSLLRADGRATIAAIGLENIAVIALGDRILVAPLDRVAEIKDLLARNRGC